MALPAGRYGVTKNQLLKIKKLPMNTIKLIEELTEKFDLLGTAAFKNSTSVVTDSSDLVESGAVFDALGFGNKNLLPYPYYLTSGSSDNATWVINSDGSVTVSTSAPLSAQVNIQLRYGDIPDELLDIPLLLSGCPSGGSSTTYEIGAFHYDGTNTARDYGDTDGVPLTFTANGDKLISITLRSGANIPTPITFYPMLRKATVSDPTYEPYHASVEESLAEKCDNSTIAPVENGSTASQAYAVGEHFIRDGAFCTCKQAISQGGSFTLGTNYTAGDVADELDVIDITNDYFSSALPTNVSLRNYSKIFKIGRVIIGNIVFYKSDGIAVSDSIEIPVNSNYKPLLAVNSFCYMGDSEWQSPTNYDIAYLYIDDRVIARNMNSNQTPTYAKINFVYVI